VIAIVVAVPAEAATAGKHEVGARPDFALMGGWLGLALARGSAMDQAISLDYVAVLISAENVVDARRQNGWINAKENVPANRKYSKRSSVASSALPNVRNGPARAKTQTLREWFRDRNPARLSTCPDLLLIHLRSICPRHLPRRAGRSG